MVLRFIKTNLSFCLAISILTSRFSRVAALDVSVLNQGEVEQFKKENPTHVVVVFAQWCPDCMRNRERINKVKEAAVRVGLPLLSADVGDRMNYRDRKNYMRADLLYKIRSVPTAYYVIGGKISKTLDTQGFYEQTEVDGFIAELEKRANSNSASP